MFLCGFPTELANIIDFAQAKSNKKIGQTRFSSTCFESRLSLKGGVPRGKKTNALSNICGFP